MIRTLLIGAASASALLVAASAASAADLPIAEPAPMIAVPSFSWTGVYIGAQAGYGWGRVAGGALKTNGAVLGGYLGYNYQFDASPVVVGIETDFNWSDQDDRRFGIRADQKWVGSTRGRLGYAFDRFLVYGAGGLSYSKLQLRAGGASVSKTYTGWTAGGGVEYAFTDNLIGRVDYRYEDFGRKRGVKLTDNRLMAGIAYKF